ncbi:MAG: glycosyltransferase [Deltaproteobacteria bacterium]|nr:glycosyltransferase [Deltaproteobacteria bacterium]
MSVGIVIIGRNEGERLPRCIDSVRGADHPVVYVDSGSVDGSVVAARERGCDVVELSAERPYTAARGRNAGFRHLRQAYHVDLVQFLDGDTEVFAEWLPCATRVLEQDDAIAAVTGQRHERAPMASVFNHLCDIEWRRPAGDTASFGGDVLLRATAIERAGLYDEALIAGEDPELSQRILALGLRIVSLAADMTLHDAAMTEVAQWWARARRSGHAYAEVRALRAHAPGHFWQREVRSNWWWGAVLPLGAGALGLATLGLGFAALPAGYLALALRVYRSARHRGMRDDEARLYAVFTTLSKIPSAIGQGSYAVDAWRGKRSELIEYK